ncbi:MAG: hypothetical protein ACOY32_02425 [Thermodesulfobacteriota bacterium]
MLSQRHIKPLRLLVVFSLWLTAVGVVFYREQLTARVELALFIHLVLALSLLRECRRSDLYHRAYNASLEKNH